MDAGCEILVKYNAVVDIFSWIAYIAASVSVVANRCGFVNHMQFYTVGNSKRAIFQACLL